MNRDDMIAIAKDIVSSQLEDIEYLNTVEHKDVIDAELGDYETWEIHQIVEQVANELIGAL